MELKWYKIFGVLLLSVFSNSCSDDRNDDFHSNDPDYETIEYSYSALELEVVNLINNYRISEGLNALELVDYASFKSEEHTSYMIANGVVTHNGFVKRSEDIIKVLGAKRVSENIAYNFNSAEGAFNGWLRSAGHRKTIEGEFTNCGISIRQDTMTGKKYYTNIFVKK